MPTLRLRRLVRDGLHISGFVGVDTATGWLQQVVLNAAAPGAVPVARSLHQLLAPEQISVDIGVT